MHTKRFVVFVSIIAVVFAILGSCGPHESDGLSFGLTDNGYSLTGIGTCKDKDIYVPAERAGKKVTAVNAKAFEGCGGIRSIDLPDGVATVGMGAFADCSELERVKFGSTEGWFYTTDPNAVTGTPIDVSDPEANAAFLRNEGKDVWLKRG